MSRTVTGSGARIPAWGVLTVLLLLPRPSEAIVVASYDYEWNKGSASTDPMTTPWEIAFSLQLAPPEGEIVPFTRIVGNDVFWGDGASGTTVFNTGPAFDDFSSHATNGLPEEATLWALDRDGRGGGHRLQEAGLFQRSPDLFGYHIDAIALTVTSLQFQPWMPSADLQGYRYIANITWTFYAVETPEPSTVACLALLVALTCTQGRKGARAEKG